MIEMPKLFFCLQPTMFSVLHTERRPLVRDRHLHSSTIWATLKHWNTEITYSMFFFSVFCECEQNQKQLQQTVMFAKSSLPEPLIASANSRQLTKKEKKNKIKNIKSSLTVKILQIQTFALFLLFPFLLFWNVLSSTHNVLLLFCFYCLPRLVQQNGLYSFCHLFSSVVPTV